MSSASSKNEAVSPYRTTAYQADPNDDPNPMIRVVEALSGKRQSEIDWGKLVPYRLASLKHVSFRHWLMIALNVAGILYCKQVPLEKYQGLACHIGISLEAVYGITALLVLYTVIRIIVFLILNFREGKARIFDYKHRWHRDGYRTQFVARELRLRFQKIETLLRHRHDTYDPMRFTTPAVRTAMQEWLKWLNQPLGATCHIVLDSHLHDEPDTAARCSESLVQLVETLDQLYQDHLSLVGWERTSIHSDPSAYQESLQRAQLVFSETWSTE